jgi:hypothetical protein
VLLVKEILKISKGYKIDAAVHPPAIAEMTLEVAEFGKFFCKNFLI